MSAVTFAEAYEHCLPVVWRYVSARIPDADEAQDVTSDVFVRAWQAWAHYDGSRATPSAWLCGIARRTIADWWRARRPGGLARETPDEEAVLASPGDEEPDRTLLTEEFVADLQRSLGQLSERERDAIALRFGAGLHSWEIGTILALSEGATKMMLFRAMLKLKGALSSHGQDLQTEPIAAILDEAITSVLARRQSTIPDPLLGRIVQCLVELHDHPMPPDLPRRVGACIVCSGELGSTSGDQSLRSRMRSLLPATLRAFTAPACLVCAGAPLLLGPITTLGLLGPATVLHVSLTYLAPLNLVLLWRSFHFHRHAAGLVLAGIAVVLIYVHLSTHVLMGSNGPTTVPQIALVAGSIWLGSILLTVGAILDWRARKGLAVRLQRVPGVPAPAAMTVRTG